MPETSPTDPPCSRRRGDRSRLRLARGLAAATAERKERKKHHATLFTFDWSWIFVPCSERVTCRLCTTVLRGIGSPMLSIATNTLSPGGDSGMGRMVSPRPAPRYLLNASRVPLVTRTEFSVSGDEATWALSTGRNGAFQQVVNSDEARKPHRRSPRALPPPL